MAGQNNESLNSQRLRRFLIYGRDDGRYFVNERRVNVVRDFSQHSRIIDRMISEGRGLEVVGLIKEFVKFTSTQREDSRGWGRAQRKAVSEWYNQAAFQNNPKKLLRLGTKYKKRHGYTHRDLIRLAHVKPKTHHIEFVIQYIVKGMCSSSNFDDSDGLIREAGQFIKGVEQAKECKGNAINHLISLIRRYNLTREHIPTNLLNSRMFGEP
ncbi:SSA2 [Mytilus edulis]|uniref:TROVE2 n=1 Tax=Mytilus edulis TaxID=6550 RepID=A0A8S3SY56_MYTED|nr:SSA2 [Mytilus edulis]